MPRSRSSRRRVHGDAVGPFTLERLVELLHGEGARMTDKRRAILQVLLAAAKPLRLEQIQREATRHTTGGEVPDFATVFRLMTLLESLGLVRRINLGRAPSHFELADPSRHRDHLVCTDCGTVTPLEESCPVKQMERQIAREHGFTKLTHSLEFFGKCADCSTDS